MRLMLAIILSLLTLSACGGMEEFDNRRDIPAHKFQEELSSDPVSSEGNHLTESEKKEKIRALVERSDFLGLFENARSIGKLRLGDANYFIDEAVNEYLDVHGRDRASVIAALQGAGFTFKERLPFNAQSRPIDDPSLDYDEIIAGEMRASTIAVVIWNTYQVSFYLHNGIVVGVMAHAFTDAL